MQAGLGAWPPGRSVQDVGHGADLVARQCLRWNTATALRAHILSGPSCAAAAEPC